MRGTLRFARLHCSRVGRKGPDLAEKNTFPDLVIPTLG